MFKVLCRANSQALVIIKANQIIFLTCKVCIVEVCRARLSWMAWLSGLACESAYFRIPDAAIAS